MLQKNNDGHIVAIQSLAKKLNLGILFNTMPELRQLVENKKLMEGIRNNVWQKRHLFTFDYHVDDLVGFFKSVIKKNRRIKQIESKNELVSITV